MCKCSGLYQSLNYKTTPKIAKLVLCVYIFYYMACSASGQDESNPALWLATRAGKIKLSCPLGTTRRVPQEKFPKSHIINPLLTKFVRSRWLDIDLILFFASLWTETESRSINTQKKNLANIQPSWPRTWPITSICCSKRTRMKLKTDLCSRLCQRTNSSRGIFYSIIKLIEVTRLDTVGDSRHGFC